MRMSMPRSGLLGDLCESCFDCNCSYHCNCSPYQDEEEAPHIGNWCQPIWPRFYRLLFWFLFLNTHKLSKYNRIWRLVFEKHSGLKNNLIGPVGCPTRWYLLSQLAKKSLVWKQEHLRIGFEIASFSVATRWVPESDFCQRMLQVKE